MPHSIGHDNVRPCSRSTAVAPSQGGHPMQPSPFFPPYLPWPYPGQFNPPNQPSGACCHHLTSSHRMPSPAPLPSIADTPDIIAWFAFLDHDEQCGINGVNFASYGPVLKENGYLHLYQLGLDSVRPSDLQELGIKAGLAVLILDYVKQDLKAMRLRV